MQSLWDWWNSVIGIPGAAWIIYPSLLVVLILVAYYVLQAIRNLAIGGSVASDDHLGTFRKMRDEGVLDPEEYKKLAGLVPMPEAAPADIMPKESGSKALAEAAKDAIRKSALKQSDETSQENNDLNSAEEGDQSAES